LAKLTPGSADTANDPVGTSLFSGGAYSLYGRGCRLPQTIRFRRAVAADLVFALGEWSSIPCESPAGKAIGGVRKVIGQGTSRLILKLSQVEDQRWGEFLLLPTAQKLRGTAPVFFVLLASLTVLGCASPYYADRGALLGGLLGAGTGAVVGKALGSTAAGALFGAGVGAITGAAVGEGLDEIEARNRAMIAAQLGREVGPGPVSIEEIVMMVKAGVEDELIINHIRANGVTRQPGPHEIVTLRQEGVSAAVIRAIQDAAHTGPRSAVVIREAPPPPVIIEEYHYGPWWWSGPRYRYYYHPPRSRITWGFSVSR